MERTACIVCGKPINNTDPHDCYPTRSAEEVLEEQFEHLHLPQAKRQEIRDSMPFMKWTNKIINSNNLAKP